MKMTKWEKFGQTVRSSGRNYTKAEIHFAASPQPSADNSMLHFIKETVAQACRQVKNVFVEISHLLYKNTILQIAASTCKFLLCIIIQFRELPFFFLLLLLHITFQTKASQRFHLQKWTAFYIFF